MLAYLLAGEADDECFSRSSIAASGLLSSFISAPWRAISCWIDVGGMIPWPAKLNRPAALEGGMPWRPARDGGSPGAPGGTPGSPPGPPAACWKNLKYKIMIMFLLTRENSNPAVSKNVCYRQTDRPTLIYMYIIIDLLCKDFIFFCKIKLCPHSR